jgi:predicted glycogen debranching enzyme
LFELQELIRRQTGDPNFECPLISGTDKADCGREFLLTNSLGGYASGGMAGENSRRYHGLFVPALEPPVDRTVMVSHLDEVVTVSGGEPVEIATNLWRSAVAPEGYRHLLQFTINPCPSWSFQVGDGVLVKQVAMIPGKQQVVIGYTYLAALPAAAKLSIAVLANFRNFHGETRGSHSWQFEQEWLDGRLSVRAFPGAQEMVVRFDKGSYRQDSCWYWGYRYPREYERGLNDSEDCYRLGFIEAELEPGESLSLVCELGGQLPERLRSGDLTIGDTVRRMAGNQKELCRRAGNPADKHLRQLTLAADQFIVYRDSTHGSSIIAGYHWFNDWGRDAMISLPGLTLSTGRFDVARSVLTTFGAHLSQGMLPNCFPDQGEAPAYNTADATFWWGWTLHHYLAATGDIKFIREQLPLLDSVVEWHKRGSRHKLKVDPRDGLVTGGESGTQLTWMDAKVGDLVVTARQGKPVEICALWYNFLRILAEFYRRCATAGGIGDSEAALKKASQYDAMADQAKQGMLQFWDDRRGCLFDCIADDGQKDRSVRPNQLMALSLPYPAFSKERGSRILAVVEAELLTPYGLRTLSPKDPAYQGHYGGGKGQANQYDRDVTYHQGTVWPWLLGPWAEARLFVHGETADNARFILAHLDPIMHHILNDAGIGSVSEIFDGDEPFTARGCIAQAWSVAELLRIRKKLLQLLGSAAAPHVVAATAS